MATWVVLDKHKTILMQILFLISLRVMQITGVPWGKTGDIKIKRTAVMSKEKTGST